MSLADDVRAPIRHADRFFIGGQWVQPSSDATIKVIDSGTEELFFSVAEAQAADIPYDSEAEAVALANQTWSGLCSSVWSADTGHAMKIAGQLRTGVTFFNNHNATAVDERAPFGGFNASGIGRELGRPGLQEFTETHVTAVPSGG
jgi:acyl-CoA reductase-like NAD-dependent aldehyde dehydrogenase